MARSKKTKKTKRVKLPSVAFLRRKAMKLWTDKVKDMQGRVCAICGLQDGSDNGKGGRSWTNAHHIEDRSNYALRWDILNGIAVCPSHHEFSKNSFHRSPVWSLNWLKEHRPQVIDYIMSNRSSRPQTAKDYSREDMLKIIEKLSQPPTALELEILGLDRPKIDASEKTNQK